MKHRELHEKLEGHTRTETPEASAKRSIELLEGQTGPTCKRCHDKDKTASHMWCDVMWSPGTPLHEAKWLSEGHIKQSNAVHFECGTARARVMNLGERGCLEEPGSLDSVEAATEECAILIFRVQGCTATPPPLTLLPRALARRKREAVHRCLLRCWVSRLPRWLQGYLNYHRGKKPDDVLANTTTFNMILRSVHTPKKTMTTFHNAQSYMS
jgi:hypothetical protein